MTSYAEAVASQFLSDPDTLAESRALLRKPFPPEAIDTLPKGGVKLSYVGHAQTTARLLDADPEWTWEPVAFDEHGLPALTRKQDGTPFGLWIRLTLCGVTRYGFGELPAAKGADGIKEAIGDAIRNAAMRFGVALDLWAKGDLAHEQTSSAAPHASSDATAEEPGAGEASAPPRSSPAPTKKRTAANKKFHALLNDMDLDYETQVRPAIAKKYDGRTLSGLEDDELVALVKKLDADQVARERFRAFCLVSSPAAEEGAA